MVKLKQASKEMCQCHMILFHEKHAKIPFLIASLSSQKQSDTDQTVETVQKLRI